MPVMRRSRSPHDVRSRRRQLLTYALAFGVFVVVVNALVGDNGYLATVRASRDHAALQESLDKVLQENARLEEQIRSMKDDPTALEEAARKQLNLMRAGEKLIIVKDAKPAASPAPGK
jgi:cell division protein FtsB